MSSADDELPGHSPGHEEVSDRPRRPERKTPSTLPESPESAIESPPSADGPIRITDRMRMIAERDGPVLLVGETGTGKTALCGKLHQLSSRRTSTIIVKGCGEFDAGTLEATLFGHTRDAYTSAASDQKGLLHHTNGGILVLDDIDYLSTTSQARLLRFLDDGTYFRLGDPGRPQYADVRVFATTNKNLKEQVEKCLFLPDLMYRLSRWQISLPPLRNRPSEIRDFATNHLRQLQRQDDPPNNGQFRFLAPAALDLLAEMPWPGNYRELMAALENIILFHEGQDAAIGVDAVSRILFDADLHAAPPSHLPLEPGLSEDERIYRVLVQTRWNITRTATIVGRSRTTIYERIRSKGWRMP